MAARTLAALAVAAGASFACTVTEPNAPPIDVRVEHRSYARSTVGVALVRFELHNTGRLPAYFLGCQTPIAWVLERDRDGQWSEASGNSALCPANIVPASLLLEPRESFLDSLRFDLAGFYRLRVWFGSAARAPYEYSVVSGGFEIR